MTLLVAVRWGSVVLKLAAFAVGLVAADGCHLAQPGPLAHGGARCSGDYFWDMLFQRGGGEPVDAGGRDQRRAPASSEASVLQAPEMTRDCAARRERLVRACRAAVGAVHWPR